MSGLLNVRGVLGGSASAPTGLIKVKLLDGALGRQQLARSTASIALNSRQQMTLDVELAPADSHGYVRLAGSIDLLGRQEEEERGQQQAGAAGGSSPSGSTAVSAGAVDAAATGGASSKGVAAEGATTHAAATISSSSSRGKKKKGKGAQHHAQGNSMDAADGSVADAPQAAAIINSSSSEPYLELGLSVRDGGMSLLTSLAPGLTWGGGSASVNFAATGPAASPLLTGSASFNKGSLGTSVLRHPLTQLSGSLAVDGDTLAVSGLEAKVGPKGTLAVRGALPLTPHSQNGGSNAAASGGGGGVSDRLHASAAGVELRVRNMYSGSLDADLDLRGSLASPVLGGRIVFSKGTAYLVPPAASSNTPAAGSEAAAAAAAASSSNSSQAELVRTAFAALKAGRARAATAAAADARGQVGRLFARVGVWRIAVLCSQAPKVQRLSVTTKSI